MDIEETLNTYGDGLYRLCLVMLQSHADAEDALQETLIRYYQKAPVFSDSEHKKAWLYKVAANQCRDMLRRRARHPQTDLDTLSIPAPEAADSGIWEALGQLPDMYRLVLTLHYGDGYTVNQIAKIIKRTPSAVKMRLQKGRRLLEAVYRKEYLE